MAATLAESASRVDAFADDTDLHQDADGFAGLELPDIDPRGGGLAIGLAAAYVPARRAARVDPILALRTE